MPYNGDLNSHIGTRFGLARYSFPVVRAVAKSPFVQRVTFIRFSIASSHIILPEIWHKSLPLIPYISKRRQTGKIFRPRIRLR